MKNTLKNIIGTLSLSAVALTASAQGIKESSPTESKRSEQSQDPKLTSASTRLDPGEQTTRPIGAVKAEEFIGMDVVNLQGEELGSVSEIAVDVESGRIVGVILSTGGFLGIGAEETVVPPSAFDLDGEGETLRLDADKERLLASPRFDLSDWSKAFTSERLASVYRHFGLESSYDFVDEADQTRKPFTVPESRLKGIQRGSEIIGMEVSTPRSREIGEISEIILDLPAGRIVALIVTSGDFLEIEGELSAIPASSFRFSTDRETLQVDTNKAALEAAPHFKEGQWPDFTREETVRAIFSAHSVEPYTRSGSITSRSTTTERDQDTASQAKQGKNPADMATTSAIKKEIRENEKLSLNARNVTVVTSEGHTTLTGPVDTADEKQVVGEIANRNNREEDVKNLLVVKAEATKSE